LSPFSEAIAAFTLPVVTVSVTAFAVVEVELFAFDVLLVSVLEDGVVDAVFDVVSLELVLLGEVVVVVVVVEAGDALLPELLYAVVLGRSQPVTAAPARTTMATRGIKRFMVEVSVLSVVDR